MILQNATGTRHIFLADDDEDDRVIFSEALMEIDTDVKITHAENGIELMDILHGGSTPKPDLLFLDLNMPKRGGLECLEAIRQDENGLKNLKVVMLTTSSNPSNIDAAYKLGASLYAVKPNTYSGLKELIRNILDWNWQAVPPHRNEFVIG